MLFVFTRLKVFNALHSSAGLLLHFKILFMEQAKAHPLHAVLSRYEIQGYRRDIFYMMYSQFCSWYALPRYEIPSS